ncbi:acyl-ACP--UDP-N-acetylglucosamine O-acyltransferase [Geomesophilobacter sediminis]|uniref:Acyl-[acyl-carrier-protein]--UDP-N-acetylglucosamine O-acyltransferase n=1 Tax=Geomesophilobacter sediminis TaxID=2798584 RepID=A0A8J7IS21_9BACT|nr:acyl-ACP--UDP-N-acetylglucosamine O-acyltransferase [Geomesophilobacter sediminis]MBJ6725959.1 acyl-ACP--UDP-N-acetylglucosamine O-acyltransferase [Geomesophilobacter sediminis]
MIHSTAIIHPGAQIADGVEIGPYAVIGEHVKIGKGTKVGPHAVIDGWTEIGEANTIFQLASVGAIPQDLKYKGEETYLRIGNGNTIREFATLHLGTVTGDGETTVGDGNLFMAYSHVAHDCHIGSHVVMANGATLAGHVTIEDYVILGGLCAVHQFARIGESVMVGGGCLIGNDVPPYTIITGEGRDLRLRGLNLIGLKRRGFSDETISRLKRAYKILSLSGLKLTEAVEKMKTDVESCPEVDRFISFIENSTQRGVCR